ncbi:hypothetical protein T484DRAFT_1917867 [Baffinella frigidus]|nr:hypothetical protein T484DRAFT_1917867 [Cryptophyta sp. CCMP2293]
MSREHTPMTPVDFVNAFCGTQTSQTCPDMRPYIPLAEDLLLCSLGATPRAEDTSANYNAHAGAARWLQRATTPLRGGRRGSETSALSPPRGWMAPSLHVVQAAECRQNGQPGGPVGVSK